MRWKRFIHDRALISTKKAVTAYKEASEACGSSGCSRHGRGCGERGERDAMVCE